MKKVLTIIALFAITSCILPFATIQAQAPPPGRNCNTPGGAPALSNGINCLRDNAALTGGLIRQTSIPELIFTVLLWMLGLVGILTLVAIIFGGFKYITAFGDEKKTEAAKKIIIGAIIGVLIIATSFMMLQIIRGLLGIT